MQHLAPKPMALAIAVAAAFWGTSAQALVVDANMSGSLTVDGSVVAAQATPATAPRSRAPTPLPASAV